MHQRSFRRTMKSRLTIDRAAAIGLVDLLQRHDILAGARRRREFESNCLTPFWRLDAVDLLEFLHTALHLRSVRSAGLEAFDELDFLGEHGLLAFELRLLLLFVLRALLFVKP